MEDPDETRSSAGGGDIHIPHNDPAKDITPDSPASGYADYYWWVRVEESIKIIMLFFSLTLYRVWTFEPSLLFYSLLRVT